MAALTCPHCESISTFSLKNQWETATQGHRQVWGVWVCSNTSCEQPIVGRMSNHREPVEYWPNSPVRLPSFDDVPDSIKSDGQDAHRCIHVNAYRAAAVMARRAIQGACFDKGAPDKRPVDQIDYLKDQAVITPQMADIAHHIRALGGTGAHPDKDGLEDVGRDEAEQALAFLGDFMNYVYTIPASLARVKSIGQSSST